MIDKLNEELEIVVKSTANFIVYAFKSFEKPNKQLYAYLADIPKTNFYDCPNEDRATNYELWHYEIYHTVGSLFVEYVGCQESMTIPKRFEGMLYETIEKTVAEVIDKAREATK